MTTRNTLKGICYELTKIHGPLTKKQIMALTGWDRFKADDTVWRAKERGEITGEEIANPEWKPHSQANSMCYLYTNNPEFEPVYSKLQAAKKKKLKEAIKLLEVNGYIIKAPRLDK